MWVNLALVSSNNTNIRVDFIFLSFSPAAESSWGKSVSQTSAPAGHCACGSVSHAPHRWVKYKGQDVLDMDGVSSLSSRTFLTPRRHNFFHISSHRLPEQSFPWFQGIWRYPRYPKQTAASVWTEAAHSAIYCTQESVIGLCMLLCVYREFICAHLAWRDGHERANLDFFWFVVVTHQTVISGLLCEVCNM